MKKHELIKLLAMLSAAYPNMKEINDLMVDIWYDCLKDVNIEVALAAVKKNILESPFPPSVADIRKQVSEVTTATEDKLDSSDAWGEVTKAIQVYGSYNEIKALESMSKATSKVVKYMGWRELCLSENLGVVRGQFLKMYATVAEREKQDRLLPVDFKQEINQIAENKKAIENLSKSMDIKNALN